jgi:cytochrome c553
MRVSILYLLLSITISFSASQSLGREWADATGIFRIEAELVVVRGDKVVLEKPDGKIISVPIARLSRADRDFLEKLSAPKPSTPKKMDSDTKSSSALPVGDAKKLALKTESILRTACYRCHGENGTSEGGFNFVADLEKLAKTFAKKGEESLLVERITADDDGVMPPVGEEPRLSKSDISTIHTWIAAGMPTIARHAEREFITNETIVESVLADIRTKRERSQRFMRYFTLTHLYNAGVSEDELQTYRNAFVKLINSLSWNTDLVIPRAIDSAKTVYEIDMRDLHWTESNWRAIEEANPYAIRLATPAALACVDASQTEMPYVRIDWFVAAASKPPLYHEVLNIPDTDLELEQMLRVNVQSNIDQEQTIRAAFNRSGVSQNNRLIEWHKSPYGSYWKSYDFGGNTGHKNLFQYPMGPDNGADSFQHDGGEIIFTLPNGLQGYLLVDENGSRIDQGPTNIVSDPKRHDRAVTNGVSCMSCHYTGVISKKDEVGVAVRANRVAFEEADDILALYRESDELDRVLERDRKRFSDVLEKLGIMHLSRSGESISAMSMRFQQDIDLKHVSSEFGLEPGEFLKRLTNARRVARVFSSLQIDGGTIKRDVIKEMFGEACVDLRLTTSSGVPRRPPMTASSGSSRPRASRTPRNRKSAIVEQVAVFDDLSWGVSSVAFHPGNRLLAGGKPDRALMIFDVENQSVATSREQLNLLQSVATCAFTPDGSSLVAAGSTGMIIVFSVSREGMLKEVGQFAGHSKAVKCIAVSSDGRYALTGSDEKKARFWEIGSGQEIALLSDFKGSVKAVHISRDGRTLQATDGATLIEYDTRRSRIARERPLNRSWAAGQSATFSSDGKTLATGDSHNIRLWNLKTGKELPPLVSNEIQWSMAFAPDGSRLYSGGSGKVNVWDVRETKRIHVQSAGNGYVKALTVSNDGGLLAVPGANSRKLYVFKIGK